MKICVLGCGALGGLLAAFLSRHTDSLTVVDRGIQYEALRDQGLTLVSPEGVPQRVDNIEVIDSLRDGGTFDAIFVAVKAQELPSLAEDLAAAVDDGCALVTLQNGLPWWYFQRQAGPHENQVIRATDPGGRLSALVDPKNIIGCVAYPAAELVVPGTVRHIEGIRFPMGELDGQTTDRVQALSDLLVSSGLKSPVLEDIRSEIWLKAWGNLAFNPVSALTHGTMAEIATFGPTRDYVAGLMLEAQQVAGKLGVSFRVPLERRLQGAEKVGGHKTSMLQDCLAGRPMELDAILGSILELAELTACDTPGLAGLYALCSLRNEVNLNQATSGESS